MRLLLHFLVLICAASLQAQFNPGISNTGIIPALGTGILLGTDSTGKINIAQTKCPAVSCSNVSLPLHLLQFSGKTLNTINQLYWKTNDETNSSHFIIERSADGLNFLSVGSVNAFDVSGLHEYVFDDDKTLTGNNYYRLKITDKDEKFTYSKIILLRINPSLFIRVYPNPSPGIIYVQSPAGKYDVVVYNTTGKLVLVNYVQLTGQNSFQLNCSHLIPGMYELRLIETTYKTIQQVRFVISR